jgi:hypothetical protein
MANIKIENLAVNSVLGIDLFDDSESYFADLNESDIYGIEGGISSLDLIASAAFAGAVVGFAFVAAVNAYYTQPAPQITKLLN